MAPLHVFAYNSHIIHQTHNPGTHTIYTWQNINAHIICAHAPAINYTGYHIPYICTQDTFMCTHTYMCIYLEHTHIDVGFPSIFYEYVLLPVVIKEVVLANGLIE